MSVYKRRGVYRRSHYYRLRTAVVPPANRPRRPFLVLVTALIAAGAIVVAVLVLWVLRPAGRDPVSEPQRLIVSSGTIQAGDVLSSLLERHGVDRFDARETMRVFDAAYGVRRVRAGTKYELWLTTGGTLVQFGYWTTPVERVCVVRSSWGVFSADRCVLPSEEMVQTASGTVRGSLYESMVAVGLPAGIVMEFAEVFSWQVDFLTDTRDGDVFGLVYTCQQYSNDEKRDIRIRAAYYRGPAAGEHTAVWFQSGDGKLRGYYSADGKSLRKLFLRSPLRYSRVSSHFSRKRYHPVLRYWRPHHGTDFVAPVGTPVSAIGSGRVVHAGWKGGYGNTVIIRHNATYRTLYGHLRGIARGIRVGTAVAQGQTIGYLGNTGVSTGPHLHFEVHSNGVPVNFMTLKFPPAEAIPTSYRAEFSSQTAPYLAHLPR